MRRWWVVGFAVLLVSCARVRVANVPAAPPVPVAEESVPAEERGDGAEDAAAFYLLKRAPDAKNLPVERLLAASRIPRRVHRHDAISQQPTDWVPLGPGNIGGRTRALVIHPTDPNTMYAGTSGGGVWKTTDGAKTWQPLTDLLPSLAVDTIAMDPTNPGTLYAGTGEPTGSVARRGAGIFKTTDGGATWNQLPGTANPNFYLVDEIVISPNNNNQIYAATEAGIYFSPDGGATWQTSLDRSAPNSGCQGLIIRTDQSTDYLYASCGRANSPPSGIFRNTDAAGAGTWTQVLTATGMGRSSIAVAPSNQSTVYALLSSVDPKVPDFMNALLGVYRSDSNGDPGTWNALVLNTDSSRVNTSILSYPDSTFGDVCGGARGSSNGQSYLDMTLVVDPTNPNRVWAGGIDIFRSDDGGNNWGIASFWQAGSPHGAHADNHRLVFPPAYDGAQNQTLVNTSDGGVFVTTNANAAVATGDKAGCAPYQNQVAWQRLNNMFAVTEFHYGAPYPAGLWYWGGAQDNGTVRGSDFTGTNFWATLAGGDGGYVAVNPQDANVIYHEFNGLSVAKSINGGQTFSSSIKGITEDAGNFLFIPPFTLDPSNPNTMYTGGQTLWRSFDGASSWNAAGAAIPNAAGGISTIAVSPNDSNRALFGTSSGRIYRNTNATGTDQTAMWSFAAPRTGFVASLAFDPTTPDIAYASYSTYKTGTQNYVYKTTDGGITWTGIDSGGLPDAPVSSIVVDPLNASNIYAGTDLGVFVSLDGGMTWALEDTPFVNTPIVNLAIDRGAGVTNLFAFTTGRGVWKFTLPNSGTQCQYKVDLSKVTLPAYGTPAPVNITTGGSCAWVAIPAGSGVQVQSPASGTGSGPVNVAAPINTASAARSGAVYVQDQVIAVSQAGALAVPVNDEVTSAANISVPYVGIEDTRSRTSNPSDPVHSCTQSADYKTVWWSLTAANSGTLTISVQGERYDAGGNSGVVLTVYDAASNELACVQHKRDTFAWQMVSTNLPVTAGNTYLVEVSATGNTANDGGYTILAAAIN